MCINFFFFNTARISFLSRFGERKAALCQEGLSSTRDRPTEKFLSRSPAVVIVNLTSRFWWINKGDLDIRGCARRGLLPVPETARSELVVLVCANCLTGVVFMRAQ